MAGSGSNLNREQDMPKEEYDKRERLKTGDRLDKLSEITKRID
jgi:hypothetical protein